jgi:hypothetical protein
VKHPPERPPGAGAGYFKEIGMKSEKRFSRIWTVAALALALATGFLIGVSPREKQPQMQAALNSLRAAENHLVKATHDKGGHRKNALEHTRNAIQEVIKGIEYDNKR